MSKIITKFLNTVINFKYFLFLSFLITANLYGAADDSEDFHCTADDQAAFAAILKIRALAEVASREAIETGEMSWIKSGSRDWPNANSYYNLTAAGIYITDDAQRLGTPFGMIRLYGSCSYTAGGLRKFTQRLKNKFETLLIDDAMAKTSYDYDHDHTPKHAILTVDDQTVPSILFITKASYREQEKIPEIARTKWDSLKAAHRAKLAAEVATADPR